MAAFVDYWNRPGAWDRLRPAQQAALVRWAPKAPLDFKALIDEPTPAPAYGAGVPGPDPARERAPAPTRLIAQGLQRLMPHCRLLEIDGAGHMGPLTHAQQVSALIARHISTVEADAGRAEQTRWRPPAWPKCWASARARRRPCRDLRHPPLSGAPDRCGALAEGSRVTIRPTLPQDIDLQRAFFRALSPRPAVTVS